MVNLWLILMDNLWFIEIGGLQTLWMTKIPYIISGWWLTYPHL